MNLIPIGKRTIIKPFENEEKKTASNIIISVSVQEKYSDTGSVISSDKYEAGQIVFFAPYSYSQIAVDDKKYFVMFTEDVLGVIQ